MKALAAGIAAALALLVIPLLVLLVPAGASTTTGVPAPWSAAVHAAAASCPGLPPAVLAAQLATESGWRPEAVSPAGAQGLAQFMPATWRAFGVDASGDGVADPFQPLDAIASAARYDCHLLRLVADVPGAPLELMLAAYNAGPSAVLEHRGIPPYPETQAYVRRVLAAIDQYAPQSSTGADGLTPNAAVVRQYVIERYGVTDIGGLARDGHVEGSDHYTGRAVDVMLTPVTPDNVALGWRIAIDLQSQAQRFGITYLIWQGRIWSVSRAAEGWRPYRHPSGGTSPTLLHLDHVHVSVR